MIHIDLQDSQQSQQQEQPTQTQQQQQQQQPPQVQQPQSEAELEKTTQKKRVFVRKSQNLNDNGEATTKKRRT